MRDAAFEEPEDVRFWVGRCGVCGNEFASKEMHKDNPYPHGAFCPACQDRGAMAPGVLHFKPEEPEMTKRKITLTGDRDPKDRSIRDATLEYRCVHGHDKCAEMYPGPDCPYCERVKEKP